MKAQPSQFEQSLAGQSSPSPSKEEITGSCGHVYIFSWNAKNRATWNEQLAKELQAAMRNGCPACRTAKHRAAQLRGERNKLKKLARQSWPDDVTISILRHAETDTWLGQMRFPDEQTFSAVGASPMEVIQALTRQFKRTLVPTPPEAGAA